MRTSLILSPLWAFWHVPIWLALWRAAGMLDSYDLVMYLLFITVWTIVMTWVFDNTHGSVLIAILLHTSVGAFPNGILWQLFPASNTVTDYGVLVGYLGMTIGLGAAATNPPSSCVPDSRQRTASLRFATLSPTTIKTYAIKRRPRNIRGLLGA